jgi:glucose/arabinose dehydrogenase/PKD repeat protein
MGCIYTKFVIALASIFLLFTPASKLSAQLPTGFTSNLVQNGYTAPMGVIFSSNGNSMFTWDKAGRIFVSQWNGIAYVKQTDAVLDISDEVGNWRDFGLLSVCVDPDFDLNGLIYLYYVVDRHHLLYAGTPQYNSATNEYLKATIGRVTSYRLNLGAAVTADYTSRKILIGESKKTGVPILQTTHAGGTLVFGRDKTLLLSTGDGASPSSTDVGSASESYYLQALLDSIIRPEENVGSFRSQMLNSNSGKILRFDPATGDGISSNPFYDTANPRSPRSRVWAMGLRNPFRMSIQANSGSTNPADADPGVLHLGDVGYSTWEEINIVKAGGLNFGWPLFEGQIANNVYYSANTINPDEGQPFKSLCLQPTSFTIDPVVTNRRFTHYRPAVAWNHKATDARVPWFNGTTPTAPQIGAAGSPTSGQSFYGNCAVGGLYYTGSAFGSTYQNTYFFADYGVNFIKNAHLNTTDPWMNDISTFAPYNYGKGIVDLVQNPIDGSIFYVNINSGEIRRISLGGNLPPVTAISSDVNNGLSPLTVNFSSAGTVDPQNGPLTYLWDFGDSTTSTLANPSHTFTRIGIDSFVVTLTVTNAISLFSSKSLVISINNTTPVAKINNPANNSTYSILSETDLYLTAIVTDNETTTGMRYAWQVILRHNNHEHREPVITESNPTVTISPIGCDGETYYYLIQLTVTDNGGLVAEDSVKIYPNCATGGLSVSNLTATPQNNAVLLSWTNPSASFDEVMIAAQPSKGFLSNPAGTNYIADPNFAGFGSTFEQGKIVYKGSGQSVTVLKLISGIRYYFRVFTRIGNSWTGGVEISAMIPPTLTGVGVSSTTAINLSDEGKTDWAHWPGYDHKLAGGKKISNFGIAGTTVATSYSNDPRSCSWTDGTPFLNGSNQNGVYIAGIGNGFRITLPADQTLRTLKVYVGGYKSGGKLTAQLSDGSSADFVDTSFSGTGQYNAVYTLTYYAASAGKLLTVRWVQFSGTGNVTLQAATLVESKVTGITISPTSVILSSTKQLTATITPAIGINQNVTWKSSNNAVATVSSSGFVTAVSAGSATITVTTQDGNISANCEVTVPSDTKLLVIYPNPFRDNLALTYSNKENGSGKIVIYDSEMRVVGKYIFDKVSWNYNKKISTNYLPRGIYFIELNLGTTRITKKLIKM